MSISGFVRRAAVALVIAVVVAGCEGAPAGPATPGGGIASAGGETPGAPTAVPSGQLDAAFPREIAGLPVHTVADAMAMLGAGSLDGRALAVAGYYGEFVPSCPYPGRYVGPLEGWCRYVAFTDTVAGATLCQPEGSNGTSCHQASGPNLAPFFMAETSGNAWSLLNGGGGGTPAALVVIGHAGDARQWQCTAESQARCASAFVVDRIAWADGHDLPPTAPATGDLLSGKPITPRLTLAQVGDAAGAGDELLTAAAFRAGDIATVDPRWNLVGDDIVWLARSIGQAGSPPDAAADGTVGETVWLVDDAMGRVLDSHPLALSDDVRPSRVWTIATVRGVACCAGDVFPFVRVQSADGTPVYEGMIQGGSGGSDATTYGGTYGSLPLVLPSGGYTMTTWLAGYASGVQGPPIGECSTPFTVTAGEDMALNATFEPDQACTLGPAPLPSADP